MNHDLHEMASPPRPPDLPPRPSLLVAAPETVRRAVKKATLPNAKTEAVATMAAFEMIRELRQALQGMCDARDSYNNEFNPGGRCKKVADWQLINDAWCDASNALGKSAKYYPDLCKKQNT